MLTTPSRDAFLLLTLAADVARVRRMNRGHDRGRAVRWSSSERELSLRALAGEAGSSKREVGWPRSVSAGSPGELCRQLKHELPATRSTLSAPYISHPTSPLGSCPSVGTRTRHPNFFVPLELGPNPCPKQVLSLLQGGLACHLATHQDG